MIWVGIEPLVKNNPALALDHAARSRMPVVARFIARRALDADAIEMLVAAIGKQPTDDTRMLEGMRDGVEGRYDLIAPSNWSSVYDRLKRSGGPAADLRPSDRAAVRRRGHDSAQRQGGAQQDGAARGEAQGAPDAHASTPAAARTRSSRTAGRRAAPLRCDSRGGGIRRRVARQTAASRDTPRSPPTKRRRRSGAWPRARALRPHADRRAGRGSDSRRDVPPHVARQLRRLVGAEVRGCLGPCRSGRRPRSGRTPAIAGCSTKRAMKTANPLERTGGVPADLRTVPPDVR